MTNSVGELHFAAVTLTLRRQHFCDPSAHVSRAAIYLARILSRKRAAAVPTHPTIAINNDLATGYSCIAFRAAYHKTAGRINQVRRLFIEPLRRNYFLISSSIRVSRISFCLTSAACCVETTMAEARTGLWPWYSIETCVLASGRSQGISAFLTQSCQLTRRACERRK